MNARLQCEMRADCAEPVTYLGEKGSIYCAKCAPLRQGWERTRKLRPFELRILEAGGALPSYRPLTKAATVRALDVIAKRAES